MYKYIIRPVLFQFDPEKVHLFTIRFLSMAFAIPGVAALVRRWFSFNSPALHRNVMGLDFSNPVGLAAGFDKEAEMIDLLAPFGFGSIEIGTLTPKAQPGNDKPRLFRLKKDQALINRMGFNNKGVNVAVESLKNRQSTVIIGGNIGKNKLTDNSDAIDDYIYCFEVLFTHVDYFIVNVSSPNTPNLRALQEKEPLSKLLLKLQEMNNLKSKRKPILLKIAPDLSEQQLHEIVEIVDSTGIDGVIATNTTIGRENLQTPETLINSIGNGGLSGKPLAARSTEVIRYLRRNLSKNKCIIGVGGIMTPQDAIEKLQAGADLIQIYSGFIYNGPIFVKNINRAIFKAGL